MEENADVKSGFAVRMQFAENPYFSNSMLAKRVDFLEDGSTRLSSEPPQWHPGKVWPSLLAHALTVWLATLLQGHLKPLLDRSGPCKASETLKPMEQDFETDYATPIWGRQGCLLLVGATCE